MSRLRPIGGFLPLRIPERRASSSPSSPICEPHAWRFQNARSALHALWSMERPVRVWLPAYVCPEVTTAVPPGTEVHYFALDDALEPRLDTLAAVRPGDHVLAVDYFGRPPGDAFVAFVHAHRDVRWIEDRAHALDPGVDWGDWLLYSARKLFGVPDGGVLVAGRRPLRADAPALSPPEDLAFILPCLERFEDVDETRNDRWYARYRHAEDAMRVGATAMSVLSGALLRETDFADDRERRIANFRVLRERLDRWSFMRETDIRFAPLGFPIRVPSAADMATRLASRRIFAARHWSSLPSDPSRHAEAHATSRQLLTLPCDYRYDARDMVRVAEAVIAELGS